MAQRHFISSSIHEHFGERDSITDDEAGQHIRSYLPELRRIGVGPRNAVQFDFKGVEFQLSQTGSNLLEAAAEREGFAVTYGTYNETVWKNQTPLDKQSVNNIAKMASTVNKSMTDSSVELLLDTEDSYGIRLLRAGDWVSSLIMTKREHPKVIKAAEGMPDDLVADGLRLVNSNGEFTRLTPFGFLIFETVALGRIFSNEGGHSGSVAYDDIVESVSKDPWNFNPDGILEATFMANKALKQLGYIIEAEQRGRVQGRSHRRLVKM